MYGFYVLSLFYFIFPHRYYTFCKCENSTGVTKKYIIKEFYLKGGM